MSDDVEVDCVHAHHLYLMHSTEENSFMHTEIKPIHGDIREPRHGVIHMSGCCCGSQVVGQNNGGNLTYNLKQSMPMNSDYLE